MMFRRQLVIASAFAACLCSVPAGAQSQEARITGVVRDTTGAPVAGVPVTATNQATKASHDAITAVDGTYSLAVPGERTPSRRRCPASVRGRAK